MLDINGETCLFYAVCSKYVDARMELVEYLLAQGVSVNTQNKKGLTALNMAVDAESSNSDLVDVLIAAGAKVYKDCDGLSLLTKAALRSDTDLFRRLFDLEEIGMEERIEALEIIGVTLTKGYMERDEASLPSISYIVMYWEISLDKR